MTIPFDKVTIIGFGLIGSSIARAIKKAEPSIEITAFDNNLKAVEVIRQLNLADRITLNISECVTNAQLVLICTPISMVEQVCKDITPNLSQGCIVSDVGSVKQHIVKIFNKNLPKYVHAIPAHPVAGTEKSGPKNGIADLFKHRFCIVTPSTTTNKQALKRLTAFWKALGSYVELMTPKHHDYVLATTSHLPHLLAYTLVGTASAYEQQLAQEYANLTIKQRTITAPEVIKFSAGGFRDFTRIAGSNPAMWRDVFLCNRKPVLRLLQMFEKDLKFLKQALQKNDAKTLEAWFSNTREIRENIIELDQAGQFIATESLEKKETLDKKRTK